MSGGRFRTLVLLVLCGLYGGFAGYWIGERKWLLSGLWASGVLLVWAGMMVPHLRFRSPGRRRWPSAPVNVHALMRDGRAVPIECRFVGRHRGHDTWETVTPLDAVPVGMVAEVMPPNTVIMCTVRLPR